MVFFDKNNSIPHAWTDNLDFQHFPQFIKLHIGIMFIGEQNKRLEFEDFDGKMHSIETFYVLQISEKPGGNVVWRRP